MRTFGLPLLIVAMSILYITVIPDDPLAVKLLFKVIPMALIIVYAWSRLPKNRQRFHWAAIIGLSFCMIGDATIEWFVVGLSAFLIGHLCYMTGFFQQWRYSAVRFAAIIPIALYSIYMAAQLVQALNEQGKTNLIIPVIAYITVIALMTWSAVMTGHRWAIIGSLLFMASDSILSWNMFIEEIAYSRAFIMTTYYAAQLCLAHNVGCPMKAEQSSQRFTVDLK
ncbi:lysoplasmalogenase [Paenibacillus xylaniclasticus]|uniref:lysoplasmalogenase n=1 Tax=Paenibacillus xylaniclasticus TaxID=588083 RepID=UPI001776AC88|nr:MULTISPECIES: lysoplasmalogenase [Paenibacillus]GFN32870.1 membrane protein [Paenibacillus curdlanolyticus]